MVERTEPIRQDIAATRASMTNTLEQIEGQVRDKVDTTMSQARQALDLRHQVNERPWMSLGAALVVGFVVGSMGGNDEPSYQERGQPMRYYSTETRHSDSHPPSTQGGDHNSYSDQMASAMSQIAGPVREELSMIATAAVRSAMRVLRESLQDSIPQFDTEYRAVQHEREDASGSMSSEERAQAVGESRTIASSPANSL